MMEFRLRFDLNMDVIVVPGGATTLKSEKRRRHTETCRKIRLDEYPLDAELLSLIRQPSQRCRGSCRFQRPVGIERLKEAQIPSQTQQ